MSITVGLFCAGDVLRPKFSQKQCIECGDRHVASEIIRFLPTTENIRSQSALEWKIARQDNIIFAKFENKNCPVTPLIDPICCQGVSGSCSAVIPSREMWD